MSPARLRELRLVLRQALKHMRYFTAWDYTGSMRSTIARASALLEKRK